MFKNGSSWSIKVGITTSTFTTDWLNSLACDRYWINRTKQILFRRIPTVPTPLGRQRRPRLQKQRAKLETSKPNVPFSQRHRYTPQVPGEIWWTLPAWHSQSSIHNDHFLVPGATKFINYNTIHSISLPVQRQNSSAIEAKNDNREVAMMFNHNSLWIINSIRPKLAIDLQIITALTN